MNYLVVGGSTGIGLKVSEILVSEGHHVFIASRSASSRMQSITNQTVVDIDATDSEADWSFLPDSLDGIVYCGGTINLKPFKRLKNEDFLHDYSVNVIGAVNTIQASLKALKNADSASIVMFSSVAAERGLNFHASISAAKGAVEGLTKSLSAELAPDIRVNAIALSLTDTPLAEQLLNNEKKQEASNARHPLHRYGRPEDAAEAALFLLGSKSSWITGQILGVDGGMGTIQNI
ncbi:SDR family NAD(P)-dependent oxidoreductase [Cryomorphaceae bacterium 1068]|nr:SDR family NAD(P)-dependent oxidoreductase [Cryomorphaceae bacterium 1068]